MTIRKRLVLSNVLMIIIPLCLSAIVGYLLLDSFGSKYWDSLEDMFSDQNGVYSAESVIYAYRDEFFHGEWEKYAEIEDDTVVFSADEVSSMKELDQELKDLGYNFQVKIGESISYSSLTSSETKKAENYTQGNYAGVESLTLTDGNATIIKNTFTAADEKVEITVVCSNAKGAISANKSYLKKHILIFVMMFGLIVMALVIVTNLLLSRWISHMIMKPLKALQIGTREIANGNLDSEIAYHKPDEFGEVCQEFDAMRGRLKESVETRLQYEQYRRELIVGISHDLRTPLTSIKGYVEGLLDGIANTEEKKVRYYDAIHVRAMDMESLVDSLSTFAKLENHEYKYHLEPVDMNEYMMQLLKEYREETIQKRTELIYDNYAAQTDVLVDVQEMHRVFINLFENSIKYRIKDETVIQIQMKNLDDTLQITVADDGPGVPEAELTQIFNSFYRGDESRTNPENGSGLGLAIVKRIVEGHKGTITAYCEKGLVMRIILPIHQTKKEEGE
ncbi:MAG: HAMP domain-containing sensor histidine kinase [Hespellia sp.]|nr:HAMP domain-containing sensor histidine kinase [Hespellia sp.]